MNVLFVTSEALPFIKTGGLADVSAALPKALKTLNIETRIILPLYSRIKEAFKDELHFLGEFTVNLSWRNLYCGLFRAEKDGVTYYFLDNEYYFKRDNLYGYFDDGERFAFFSKAVGAAIPYLNFSPDVLHCNDWQTALLPVFKNIFFEDSLGKLPTVFSIHNIQFQGIYEKEFFYDVLGLDQKHLNILEYDGKINLLKGAVEAAERVLTVSETYAKEILDPYFSFGLDSILKGRNFKISGITNGIDQGFYNPETDKLIPFNFSANDFSAKAKNKEALQKKLGLKKAKNTPLIASISRISEQKGFDLIKYNFDSLLKNNIQFVLLGSGDKSTENFFLQKAKEYRGSVSVVTRFDEALAHEIYAGADIFLMPSKFEPCGLSQMIAMRYGTVPVVRETGGLCDTVFEGEKGNGFTFKTYNADDMLSAILRAVNLYKTKTLWNEKIKNCMFKTSGWENSAKKYSKLY